MENTRRSLNYQPIAIVGISGRYPGADTVDELWDNLIAGKDMTAVLPENRWPTLSVEERRLKMACLHEPEGFDADFFGLSKLEASEMDPRQRLIIQTAWSILEDAGYSAQQMSGSQTAFFAAVENSEYSRLADINSPLYGSSTALCMLANRVSYFFDWRGSSEVIDSSCTSSIVGIHRACQSLQNHECSAAIIAAASIVYSPKILSSLSANGMLSPTGTCKPFSEQGDGTVIGEGVAGLMVKRLGDAESDNDHIYGVITGSAVNHAGKQYSHSGRVRSIAAVNIQQQTETARQAYRLAGISANELSYIEAHGVGSKVADSNEAAALKAVFDASKRQQFCALGTLTPNIGNLDPVSGMAGIHKILMAFRNKMLPATINIDVINNTLELEKSALYINQRLKKWLPKSQSGELIVRNAAINTYSWSGVNAHMVLQEYPDTHVSATVLEKKSLLFILSAKRYSALKSYVNRYIHYLEKNQLASLEDFSYTLQLGRDTMEQRLAIIYTSQEELIKKLIYFLNNDPLNTEQCHNKNIYYHIDSISNTADNQQQGLNEKNITTMAAYWIDGKTIDWRRLYDNADKHYRLNLPGYPFQNTLFPVTLDQFAQASDSVKNSKTSQTPSETKEAIEAIVLELSGINKKDYSEDRKFTALGMDSLLISYAVARINQRLQANITALDFFAVQTPRGLAHHLTNQSYSNKNSPCEHDTGSLLNNTIELDGKTDIHRQTFAMTELQQAYYLGENDIFALGNMVAHQYLEFEMFGFNIDSWCQAWLKASQRHPMIDCYIDEGPQWRHHNTSTAYRPCLHDYSTMSQADAEQAIRQRREHLKKQAPGTGQWPLYSVAVYKMPAGKYIVHYNFSLLLLDGLSVLLLLADLQAYYLNPGIELEPLQITISDYMYGLEQFKQTGVYQRAKEYWLEQLATLMPAPILPQCKKVEAIKQYTLSDYSESLPPNDWGKLKAMAAAEGVTASMLVYTVFATILARWSEKPEFSINILHYNRLPIHQQSSYIVGNLSSTLILPTSLLNGESFSERALRLQLAFQQAMQYSAFNGLEVQQEYNRCTQRLSPGMPIVFTSLCGVEEPELSVDGLGKLTFDGVQTPQVTLDCAIFEYEGSLQIRWSVLDELFSPGVIQSMLATKLATLLQLAREPGHWDKPLSVALPAKQTHQRLITNASWQTESLVNIQQLFLEQVTLRPDKTALISDTRNLSYRELQGFSSVISARIRRLDNRQNSLVAVVMEKGWEQVAAVFAILEAGMAYLPIDASYPQQRIAQLLQLGEVNVALTQAEPATKINWPAAIQVVVVDVDLLTAEDQQSGQELLEPVYYHLDNLAYVIFTSGSTGTPKGVMMNHRAVINTLVDINQRFKIGPDDTALAISELNFDLSVFDIFGILGAGGTLVMAASKQLRDPACLLQWIKDYNVTVWNSVPAFMLILYEYLASLPEKECSAIPLRLIMLSGDWIPVALAGSLVNYFNSNQYRSNNKTSRVELISLGGATECAIWSIYHSIVESSLATESILYGKPLSNQQLYILDANLVDCPDFVVGDIYIGGSGLAQGYWKDQQKTAQAFIWHADKKIRLYKTGDLGCYVEDGNIRFLGRRDNQVKIQGYRIELGEIESSIEACDNVKKCIVNVIKSNADEKQLVAYLILVNSEDQESSDYKENSWKEIQDQVRVSLPAYMVPRYGILIDEIPLSDNGKVDRKKLPPPDFSSIAKKPVSNNNKNYFEKQISAIWCEVLNVNSINVDDNFFHLGGHSISAVRVVTKIREQLKKNITVSDLAENSTLAQLAELLMRMVRQTKSDRLVPLNKDKKGKALVLVHAIGGHIINYHTLASQWQADMPMYGIMQLGVDQRQASNIEAMAARYIELIDAAGIEAPYVIAGWSFGGIVAYEMGRQLEAAERQADAIIMIDSWAPLLSSVNNSNDETVNKSNLFDGFVRNMMASHHHEITQWPIFDTDNTEKNIRIIQEFIRSHRDDELELGIDQLSQLYQHYAFNSVAMQGFTPGFITSPVHIIKASTANKYLFQQHPAWGEQCLGWSRFVAAHLYEVPGDHYSIFDMPGQELLINHLDTILFGHKVTANNKLKEFSQS